MKLKNSLFLLLVLPFFAVADDYIVTYTRYEAGSASVSNVDVRYGDISLDEAFEFACQYMAVRLRYPNPLITFPDQLGGCVSNVTTGVFYAKDQNPRYIFYQNTLQKIAIIAKSKGWTLEQLQGGFVTLQNPTGFYKFLLFSPRAYCEMFFSQLTFNELVEFAYSLQSVPSDISSLVPLVEGNKMINAGIAASLSNIDFRVESNFEAIFDSKLFMDTAYTDIPQIRDTLFGFRALDPQQATGSNTALLQYYYSLRGFDFYSNPGGIVDQMVQDGLASSIANAVDKLYSDSWRTSTLGPLVSVQQQKSNVIAKLKAAGMTSPPNGGSFDNMNLGDLETLYEYSYNTPTSTNATLQAKALEYLKQSNDTSEDINSGVQSIRDTLASPQEVIVLNWPNDLYGSANLSNLFADAIQGFQAAWTNFNPTYTWNDGPFFERSFYNWRGLNTLEFSGNGNPDQVEIGISSFSFSPTGNFFNDVPNLIALQGRVSMDVANMVGLVAAYTQTNLAAISSTQSLENQYQEEFLQQATESLNEFSHALSSSNLLERNTHFIDTSSVFQTPAGFTEIFSGDHSIPSHINLQLPSWHFGQDDQSTPDTGSTITIDTAQYATFFQNCRYVFLFLYWGITVMIMIWLFRLFSRFISWIPLSLTGGGSHDTVSI